MRTSLRRSPQERREAGFSLIEAIIGTLVLLICAAIVLHLVRLGFAMYRLKSATTEIAQELERARDMAVEKDQRFSVIFVVDNGMFGMDRNSNGKLDSSEQLELPAGVVLAEDACITFSRVGKLAPESKQPRIVVSNERDSKRVSVSALGAVEID
jgi:Tfp pilus assembly protein FimT